MECKSNFRIMNEKTVVSASKEVRNRIVENLWSPQEMKVQFNRVYYFNLHTQAKELNLSASVGLNDVTNNTKLTKAVALTKFDSRIWSPTIYEDCTNNTTNWCIIDRQLNRKDLNTIWKLLARTHIRDIRFVNLTFTDYTMFNKIMLNSEYTNMLLFQNWVFEGEQKLSKIKLRMSIIQYSLFNCEFKLNSFPVFLNKVIACSLTEQGANISFVNTQIHTEDTLLFEKLKNNSIADIELSEDRKDYKIIIIKHALFKINELANLYIST